MASEKKDVMIVKKKKRKDKKDKKKKKKTTKKKTQERGITVNINLARAIGEAKAKAPKTARGFAPKVASIRGQRSRGDGQLNTRQAEINTNLMNNVYAIRAQADKQQQQFGEELKGLSTNLGILQTQVTQLGTQALNPPQQPINITVPPAPPAQVNVTVPPFPALPAPIVNVPPPPALPAPAPITVNVPPPPALPAPAPITVNVPPPALPAPPQPSEDEQKFRTDMKRGLVKLGQRQQGLYEGMQLMADAQHKIHHRLGGIEDAGRQIAGNQGTLLALESIYNEGFEESNVEPQQPPAPPPLPPPPPPPMETIPEEDPARVSSSVDPREEEKADLLIEEVKTADESVIQQEEKKRGIKKGGTRTAFTPAQQQSILEIAGDTLGYSRTQMTQFYKSSDIYKQLADEYQGDERAIKNRITKVKKGLEEE